MEHSSLIPSALGGRPLSPIDSAPTFDGSTYDPSLDKDRLIHLIRRVFKFMSDGRWHTLAQIAYHCNGSEASVSARLRDFRKEKFGSHTVERRCTDNPGIFEYRLNNSPTFNFDSSNQGILL